MAKLHTEEFRQEAVRIALTSDLPRRQIAEDLGVGFSTLAKWNKDHAQQTILLATKMGQLQHTWLTCLTCGVRKTELNIDLPRSGILGQMGKLNE